MRVLIADDVEDIRALVRLLLTSAEGFDVVAEASDGQEAIDRAAEYQPDVVLLDLSMPVLDGLEALPGIRAAAPAAKVVVLSAHTSVDIREAAARGGAVGYLDKNAAASGLAGRLRDVLDLTDADKSSPSPESPSSSLGG